MDTEQSKETANGECKKEELNKRSEKRESQKENSCKAKGVDKTKQSDTQSEKEAGAKKSEAALAWERLKDSLEGTRPKHILRVTFFIVCGAAVYLQIQSSLFKLMNPPVVTHTTQTDFDAVAYPAMTICRDPPFNYDYYDAYNFRTIESGLLTTQWKRFPFENHTITEFFNAATFNLSQIILTIGLKDLEDAHIINLPMEIVSRYYYNYGMCHTVIPRSEVKHVGNVRSGYGVTFRHQKQKINDLLNPIGWNVYLHDARENFTENPLILKGESFFIGVNETVNIKLEARHYRLLRDCNSSSTYSEVLCEEKCRVDSFKNKINCTGPWLDLPELSECQDYDSLSDVLKQYSGMFVNLNCCIKPCASSQFFSFVQSRTSVQDDPDKINQSFLKIYFSTRTVTIFEEKYAYDFNMFLADLGGSVGFLLGITLIGIMEIIEAMVHTLFKSDDKKKLKKDAEKKRESDLFRYEPKLNMKTLPQYSSSSTLVAEFQRY